MTAVTSTRDLASTSGTQQPLRVICGCGAVISSEMAEHDRPGTVRPCTLRSRA